VTERLIKLFGERNTATRAVLRIIDDTPGIASAAATPTHKTDDARLRQEIARVAGHLDRPWRKIYREAVKDETFAGYPPLRAWKHSAPKFDQAYAEQQVSVLFTVRNPYSWALSLYRNPYHIMGELPDTIGTFLCRPWLTVARDGIERLLPTPLDLWNRKLAAYLAFIEQAHGQDVPTTILKFEDFVTDPPVAFTRAMADIGIDCPDPNYNPAPTKRMGLSLRRRKKFYGSADWARDLTKVDIQAITERIDWNVAAQFGYFPDELQG